MKLFKDKSWLLAIKDKSARGELSFDPMYPELVEEENLAKAKTKAPAIEKPKQILSER